MNPTDKTPIKPTSDIAKPQSPEIVLDGMGVSRGIALGRVYLHDSQSVNVAEYKIAASRVETEKSRFKNAAERASQQVDLLQEKALTLHGSAGEELGLLLDAYHAMLKGSRLLRGVMDRIDRDRINAESAVQREIDEIAHGFESMEDAYLSARVTDIRDLGKRLIHCLTGVQYKPFQHLPKGAIIVAEELTPADTALLDPKVVGGIVTVLGGAESHTAIMARSLGIPAVLGVGGLLKTVRNGDSVVLDGTQGKLIHNPSAENLEKYRKARALFLRNRRSLTRLRLVPAVTKDGARIQLQANVELPSEVESALKSGAEGIGLLRSEFLFMNRDGLPSEEEQFETLKAMVLQMGGKPVTIRTLDVGGDKLARGLDIHKGANPVLGLRAVRLCLQFPEILENQLSAILRASAYGPIRILIPMVAMAEEIVAVRDVMDRVVKRLRKKNIPMSEPLPPLGVMIEVPGAALAADSLAWQSDFFAIGTNDLTQYTLAIDRADETVAHLYNPLHPAVLRLIQFSTEAALRARIPVCVCGEIAGDPRFTALLLGFGIRDLSMSAAHVPVVKQRIRNMDLVAASRRARVIMDQSDSARIAHLLDGFNDSEFPAKSG